MLAKWRLCHTRRGKLETRNLELELSYEGLECGAEYNSALCFAVFPTVSSKLRPNLVRRNYLFANPIRDVQLKVTSKNRRVRLGMLSLNVQDYFNLEENDEGNP